MGEMNRSRIEINDGKMQSTRTPDLLQNYMSCRESLDVFRASTVNARDICGLPSTDHLLAQLNEQPQQEQVSKAVYVKHGHMRCQLDEKGDVFAISDDQGHFFMKFHDKWTVTTEGVKGSREVSDVKVSNDGSYSYKDDSGKFSFDKEGRLTEAPAGDGHARKFHYDGQGQLDKIDGRLGHWEKQVNDGKVSWINKDSKTVWEGDFKLNQGILEFHASNGVAWAFTPQGKDVRLN